MIRKVVLFLTIVVLSLSVMYGVSSYSLAEVNSKAGIKVTDSENALIGIPGEIDACTVIQDSSKELNIDIVNNMPFPIKITGIDGGNSEVNITMKNMVSISHGATARVPVKIQTSQDAGLGKRDISMVYKAEWNGGSAIIKGTLKINIDEAIEIKSYMQQVKLKKCNFIEAEIIDKFNGGYKVLGIKFPEDKDIETDLAKTAVHGNKIIFPLIIASMKPNLYEIPVIFKLEKNGCIVNIKAVIFINIELEDKKD